MDAFTSDDLVAVTLLSVDVPGRAAQALLVDQAAEFAALLREVGPDRDLANETTQLDPEWPGWRLETAVRALPGIGRTTGSKLLARKRPRLFPIWDSVISEVTATTDKPFWEPLRLELRKDDGWLHERLRKRRHEAGLPEAVTALRVFDVVCWMEGKSKNF